MEGRADFLPQAVRYVKRTERVFIHCHFLILVKRLHVVEYINCRFIHTKVTNLCSDATGITRDYPEPNNNPKKLLAKLPDA